MKYSIIIHPEAETDLDEIVAYIARDSPQNAGAVADRVANGIRSLATLPRRGRPAREASRFGGDLRQLTVFPHRVLYVVRGTTVHILRIRHGHQLDFGRSEMPRID